MAFRVLSILRVGAVSNIAVGTAIKCTNIEENVVEKSQPFGGITVRCFAAAAGAAGSFGFSRLQLASQNRPPTMAFLPERR